jgi:glycine/D-amino acid oxidase-like deaminating enzyme
MSISRRGFLGASSWLLAGCAARRNPVAAGRGAVSPAARLAGVKVAADRVIRTIAGLRPYRPSGFVVRAEKLDSKTVIHNYGHGGAGITLSWGTSQLAVEEGAKTGERDCAVIGCGVMGLSTARLLQQRGCNPVIYTKAMPPSTTSNVAGGLWEPVTVFDQTRVTPDFRKQFAEASRFAFRRYQSMAGDWYGVRWLPLYSLSRDAAFQAPPPESPNSDVEPLYPEARQLARAEHPFDVPFVRRRQTMLIEPAIYLGALLRDFYAGGGRIVVQEFAAARDLMALRENLIFNCTGLGARTLFNDAELMPIKGQLVFLLPQPEVDYCTVGPGGNYMFPRHDGILLGGSHERGVETTDNDAATTDRILRENAALFGAMRG